MKYQQDKPISKPSINNPSSISGGPSILGGASGGGPKMALGQVLGSNHPLGPSNLDSFAKSKGLIIGERVDHVAANQ